MSQFISLVETRGNFYLYWRYDNFHICWRRVKNLISILDTRHSIMKTYGNFYLCWRCVTNTGVMWKFSFYRRHDNLHIYICIYIYWRYVINCISTGNMWQFLSLLETLAISISAGEMWQNLSFSLLETCEIIISSGDIRQIVSISGMWQLYLWWQYLSLLERCDSLKVYLGDILYLIATLMSFNPELMRLKKIWTGRLLSNNEQDLKLIKNLLLLLMISLKL
jgi:hypothetical protein